MALGCVFDIREFTVHDGPGMRTTVFLKGCPLRCNWCHNPESFSPVPEQLLSDAGKRTAGVYYSPDDLAAILNRQADILRNGEGGITFSGGEPLAQADFLVELIRKLDRTHVLLDSSGYAPEQDFRRVAPLCDMMYFDIKIVDKDMHRRFTGVDNEPILRNLSILSEYSVPVVIRTPLVPGVTDTPENLEAIARIARGLPNLVRVDLLPYNKAAGGKYAACGRSFAPMYDEARGVNADVSIFEKLGVPVWA